MTAINYDKVKLVLDTTTMKLEAQEGTKHQISPENSHKIRPTTSVSISMYK